MNEQKRNVELRLRNGIDIDLIDAKITLNLIEKLTEQINDRQTGTFGDDELQTLIRNCIHAVILNLTKTLERPGDKTYNLQSLIEQVCHADDLEVLKAECCKIRGDKIYGKLVDYRHTIIAHRNMEYKSYHVIEQEFAECRDYLLKNREHIEKFVKKIEDLQMDIKRSRRKKRGLPNDGSEVIRVTLSPEGSGNEKKIAVEISAEDLETNN